MAYTNDIEKKCTRPSQASPYYGSRPIEAMDEDKTTAEMVAAEFEVML